MRTGGVFTLKGEHQNDTEGFSLRTTLLCFVLLARISLNVAVTAASHKAANVVREQIQLVLLEYDGRIVCPISFQALPPPPKRFYERSLPD